MIGGGVLAVVALYAYLTSGGPKKGDLQKVARKGEEAVKDGVRRGEDGLKGNLREAEGSARNAGAELRGKKDGMGGFRAE